MQTGEQQGLVERRNRQELLIGHRASFRGDGNVLEIEVMVALTL